MKQNQQDSTAQDGADANSKVHGLFKILRQMQSLEVLLYGSASICLCKSCSFSPKLSVAYPFNHTNLLNVVGGIWLRYEKLKFHEAVKMTFQAQ